MKCAYKLVVGCIVTGWLLSTASLCFANIGDTYEQSCVRYGKPVRGEKGIAAYWIIDKNNTISETFDNNGQCNEIDYNRFDKVFTSNDILTIIAFNTPDSESIQEKPVSIGRFWATASESRFAALYVYDNHTGGRNPFVLAVVTKERTDALCAAQLKTKD